MLPLLDLPKLVSVLLNDRQTVYENWLPDVAVGVRPNPDAHNSLSWIWDLVTAIYFLGVLFGVGQLLVSIFKLRQIIRQAQVKQDHRGSYYIQESSNASFSFFHYIFIGNRAWQSELDRQSILAHERAHMRLGHSWDVLLLQVLTILVWFNPIVYWYRNVLEQLHEFQADSIALQTQAPEVYCSLLAKEALDTSQFTFANHFLINHLLLNAFL